MWPCVHGSEIGDRCVSTSHVTDTVVHIIMMVCWSVGMRARAPVTYTSTTAVDRRSTPSLGNPGRIDKNLCRCFGAPACRVFPDHLIT